MRVLVFGASITQGFWDTEGGWVARLQRHYDKKQLEDIEVNDEPTVFNLGVSGDTSQDVLARFRAETKARHRYGDVLFIFSVGTNNARTDSSEAVVSTESYVEDLQDLVKQARKFSEKILFVGLPPCDETRTMPVFWRDIYYTNKNISAIDDAAQKFCQANNIPFVSIRNLFVGHEKDLFADGLHPNDSGHELIYQKVRPHLDELLST